MQVAVKNQRGDTLESIDLNDAVFNVPMNPSLVHQAMVIYQGNKRQGTHDTKTRAQVSGGGRKPWIQKHTGRARQGSIRSPQWRHGGVVFGPHPRSYRAALPKRMKRQALRCVLSEKARQDRLVCLDSTDSIDGKTKSMAQLLENLAVSGSALVVTKGTDRDVVLAAHNLQKIWTIPVHQLNAQELLARDIVIMTVEAARWAEESLAADPHGRRGAKWATAATVSDGAAVAEPEEADPEPITDETPAEETPVIEAPVVADAEASVAEETTGAPATRPRRRRTAETAGPEAVAEPPPGEEAPAPRRRTARSAEAAAPDAATETPPTDEAPAPRRRRRTAAPADAAEAPAGEETPAPRPRRRRTAASAAPEPPADDTASEPAPPASDPENTPEEEA